MKCNEQLPCSLPEVPVEQSNAVDMRKTGSNIADHAQTYSVGKVFLVFVQQLIEISSLT
jgi:hypothetical protein